MLLVQLDVRSASASQGRDWSAQARATAERHHARVRRLVTARARSRSGMATDAAWPAAEALLGACRRHARTVAECIAAAEVADEVGDHLTGALLRDRAVEARDSFCRAATTLRETGDRLDGGA